MRNDQAEAGDVIKESEEWLGSFRAIHMAIGFFILVLLTLLQVKYQNNSVSPFEEHGALMLLFTLAVFVYTVTLLGVVTLVRTPQQQTWVSSDHLPTLGHISLVAGALACDSLLLILARPFGYVVFALSTLLFVRILLGSYRELYQLLRHAAVLSFNMFSGETIQIIVQLLDRVIHQVFPTLSVGRNSIEHEVGGTTIQVAV